jgi:hypothetical protein
MAEQNNPQSPKPGKARRVALKIAQAAGESLMMRSPILGQAFEMTQMFRRPELSEDGNHPSRLGNIMSIVRQSLVQNSTILRKIEMFADTFDTFREDVDDQKKNSPDSKEKANNGPTKEKREDDAKPSSTFVEYLDNKQNPYYLMIQDSRNYLEKIVELLVEQQRVLERSMQIEAESSERQKSLFELGNVNREPDAKTQIRTEQTLPPAVTEGLGLATPQQQDDEGGWFSEWFDGFFSTMKKKGKGSRIGRSMSRIWNNMKGVGRGLSGRWAPRGAAPSAGGGVPRTAPPLNAGGAPVVRGAPTIPSSAPPVGPATPPSPISSAPPVGPAAAAAAAGAAAGTTTTTTATGGAGTAAFSALSVPAIAAGVTIAGLVGTVATGYASVRRSEELRQRYPELRGLNLGVSQEEYLVQRPEMLAQAVEEAKRNGTFERNMRAFDLTADQSTRVEDRVGSPLATPGFGDTQRYHGMSLPLPQTDETERMEEIRRYINGISSPSTEKTQTTIHAITRPSVPLSFGTSVPSSPVIVNNQGGPTSVNNGGNVTNIITGGSSLTLPQLAYNLPSALN